MYFFISFLYHAKIIIIHIIICIIIIYGRLCQAEIAKRTLHLARSLLQSNENRSTSIFQLVSQLPLPEDYAQQELRPIVNMRVNEIIYQAA